MFNKNSVVKNPYLSKTGALLLSVYIVSMAFVGVAFPLTADALDSGFKAPSASGSPSNQWTNGNQAYVSDNSYATSNDEGFEQSYKNFNFAVPSGAQIAGIEVKVEGKSSDSSGCSAFIKMWSTSDNAHTSSKSAALVLSDATTTLGSSSDLWGATWTAADFVNNDFHLDLSYNDASGSSCTGSASIDQILVKVYWATPQI